MTRQTMRIVDGLQMVALVVRVERRSPRLARAVMGNRDGLFLCHVPRQDRSGRRKRSGRCMTRERRCRRVRVT